MLFVAPGMAFAGSGAFVAAGFGPQYHWNFCGWRPDAQTRTAACSPDRMLAFAGDTRMTSELSLFVSASTTPVPVIVTVNDPVSFGFVPDTIRRWGMATPVAMFVAVCVPLPVH